MYITLKLGLTISLEGKNFGRKFLGLSVNAILQSRVYLEFSVTGLERFSPLNSGSHD